MTNSHIGPFHPAPAQSQIYSELGRLDEAGYVTSPEIVQQDRADKISFAMDGDTSTRYAGVVVDWAIEIYRGDLKGTELALKRLASPENDR